MKIYKGENNRIIINYTTDIGQNFQFAISQADLAEIVKFANEQEEYQAIREYMQSAAESNYFGVPSMDAEKYLEDEALLHKFAADVCELQDSGHDFLEAIYLVSRQTFLDITEQDIEKGKFKTMIELAEYLADWEAYTASDCNSCTFVTFTPDSEQIEIEVRKGHFYEDALEAAESFSVDDEVKRRVSLELHYPVEEIIKETKVMHRMIKQLANAFLAAKRCGLPEF